MGRENLRRPWFIISRADSAFGNNLQCPALFSKSVYSMSSIEDILKPLKSVTFAIVGGECRAWKVSDSRGPETGVLSHD